VCGLVYLMALHGWATSRGDTCRAFEYHELSNIMSFRRGNEHDSLKKNCIFRVYLSTQFQDLFYLGVDF
jgi:hypothetical protein